AVLSYDDGCVEGCKKDSRIGHWAFWGRPNGDASGWNWRSYEEYTEGYQDFNEWEPRHHTFTQFDVNGNEIASYRQIIGVLPVDRFHEPPRAPDDVAPQPAGASADGTVVLVSYTPRNDLGIPTEERGSNQRCRTLEHDEAYGQLVTA